MGKKKDEFDVSRLMNFEWKPTVSGDAMLGAWSRFFEQLPNLTQEERQAFLQTVNLLESGRWHLKP